MHHRAIQLNWFMHKVCSSSISIDDSEGASRRMETHMHNLKCCLLLLDLYSLTSLWYNTTTHGFMLVVVCNKMQTTVKKAKRWTATAFRNCNSMFWLQFPCAYTEYVACWRCLRFLIYSLFTYVLYRNRKIAPKKTIKGAREGEGVRIRWRDRDREVEKEEEED